MSFNWSVFPAASLIHEPVLEDDCRPISTSVSSLLITTRGPAGLTRTTQSLRRDGAFEDGSICSKGKRLGASNSSSPPNVNVVTRGRFLVLFLKRLTFFVILYLVVSTNSGGQRQVKS